MTGILHSHCNIASYEGEVLNGEEGQMVVEMAVVTPVMIVMAIVVLNLMWFIEASARFDRVAPDAVLAMAVSPEGGIDGSGGDWAVCQAIERAMDGMRGVEVSVESHSAWELAEPDSIGFSFAPHLTRYVCTLTYHPWPSGFAVAGFDASIPVELAHQSVLVVDRYCSGVIF